MGSGPSSPPPRPDEAIDSQILIGHPVRGLRSSNVHGIRRGAGGVECVDNEVSAPEEITLGYRDYQERRLRAAYDPRLPVPYDPRGMRPEPMCGMSASHRADSVLHDYAFDDEDPARLGEEAAYCRAAADSHASSCTPDEPDVVEAGSVPFKGQCSVMYSYRESSKMRFGTLNVKGSL